MHESDCCKFTVWKFQDFSITQILCEIYYGDSRSAKSVILTHLEALNLDFHEFLHFMKAEKRNSEPLKWQKTEILQLLHFLKLISRKI